MDRRNIIQWYEEVRVKNLAHLTCERKDAWFYNSIGLIAIISAIIAGYDATQGGNSLLDNISPNFALIVGGCAILAAVLNAALKFLGLEKDKVQHHTAASHYASLKYELDPWINETEEKIPKELYDRIPNRLAEINKNAPRISQRILKRAKEKVKKQLSCVISDRIFYDTELTEKLKIENERVIEIGDNPVRSYICDVFELIKYEEIGKIIINGQSTMIRHDQKFLCSIHGEGIINKNIGFLQYSIRDNSSSGITTYGTMVLPLRSEVEIEGCWMSAELVGAERILIGIIKMKLQSKGTTN
jgi:hypothetical protein